MKTYRYYSLRSFFSYLARFKWQVVITFANFVVANAFLVVIPIFIGRLVGHLAAHPIERGPAMFDVWALIVCSLAHQIMWPVSEFLYQKLLLRTSYDYETLVFQEIIRKPYPYFVDKFTGKLSSYITTLSQELRNFLERLFWNYTSQVINLVSFVVILGTVNWQTGLIFVVGILLMLVVGRYTVRNNLKYEKLLTDTQSTKNGKLIDAIANFVNVKSFHTEDIETGTIRSEQAKTFAMAQQSFLWGMVFWASMGFFVRAIIWPGSILLNLYLFLHGELSVTALTTFLSAVLLFSTTVWEAVWQVSQFSLSMARVEEAHRYLFGPVNLISVLDKRPVTNLVRPAFKQALALHELTFAYPDKPDATVLNKINLTINKGEKIGVVGKSGSGKTTLTKLLLGYYPVRDGQLILDGTAISTQDLAELISYVPQDTSLFHRTIAENIAYATDKPATRRQIIAAAKKAHADSFINAIDEGYDAMVGERGVKLSAGQRQRIAIARAFLDDKPMLILDEATSALDSESEVLVQDALEALWQHKTVIAIAHRLSTLRHMDRILVIDGGEIIEQGSHAALLATRGAYAKLWAHQSGGFLEE